MDMSTRTAGEGMGVRFSRRELLGLLGATAAATAFAECGCGKCGCGGVNAKIALQLYSIKGYIKDVRGLDRALEDVAAIGFKGVEFAGYYQYAKDPKGLRKALANAGIRAVGTHVSCADYGLDTKAWTYDPEKLKETCDFNMSYGNNLVICPGGGNFPPGCSWSTGRGGEPCKPSQAIDDHTKKLVEFYNKVSADAAKMGCRIGLHNHTWEHAIFMLDGTSFWDYFFSNTSQAVCMEQDVGWTTCAGDTISGLTPMAQYVKYPHRSPTLHAKENGMGKNVKEFDAILGQPGRPGATPVDWDGLIPVTEKDGVEWYVVECERHFEDLSAVTPSYAFLKSKGLN